MAAPDPPDWSAPPPGWSATYDWPHDWSAPPAAPRRRRPGRWFAVAIGLAVIALVGGVVVAVPGYLAADGPSGVVSKYFAALRHGDAQTALAYGSIPEGNRAFLTAEVLQAQRAAGAITDVSVGTPTAGAVPVSYRVVGVQVTDTVPVRKLHGRWQLTESAVPTDVSLVAAGQRATFAGTAVPPTRVLLFAGALPVALDAAVLQVQPGSGVVRFAGGGRTRAALQVTAAGQQTISDAVKTALQTCLTAAVPSATCPLPQVAGARAVPQSLHGQLTGTPTVHLTVAPEADGKILITGEAGVEATYRGLDYQNQTVPRDSPAILTFAGHCYPSAPTTIIWDAL